MAAEQLNKELAASPDPREVVFTRIIFDTAFYPGNIARQNRKEP
jgi:hypothetical protein